MTVKQMIDRQCTHWNFIVESKSQYGKEVFNEQTSSYLEYKAVMNKEVLSWGIHNKFEKTFVLYV